MATAHADGDEVTADGTRLNDASPDGANAPEGAASLGALPVAGALHQHTMLGRVSPLNGLND
jgi:hypothetical protein